MQITIPHRLQGIEGVAQGGHLAGLVSQMLGREMTVRFHRPCPLERPLELGDDGGDVRLVDGERVVLTARDDERVPAAVPFVDLDAAETGRQWAERQPFAQNIRTCFSCGDPATSFGVHAGQIDGTSLAATPFAFPDWTVSEGIVEPRFLWAPIDCAAGWRVSLGDDGRPAVTGELRVSVLDAVHAGETLIAVADAAEWTGRTRRARSAIYRTDGTLVATSDSIWVAVG